MRFLDGDMRLPTGPSRLCRKSGAPIVPFFVVRRRNGTYRLTLGAPIVPASDATVESIQARLVRVLETAVLARPECWLLFSDLWDCDQSLEIARRGYSVFEKLPGLTTAE